MWNKIKAGFIVAGWMVAIPATIFLIGWLITLLAMYVPSWVGLAAMASICIGGFVVLCYMCYDMWRDLVEKFEND